MHQARCTEKRKREDGITLSYTVALLENIIGRGVFRVFRVYFVIADVECFLLYETECDSHGLDPTGKSFDHRSMYSHT